MRFIGDVHGKYERYKKILKGSSASIQVGDMGIGFWKTRTMGEPVPDVNPPHKRMKEFNARFIRGNHDNPGKCRSNSQWIKDGTVEGNMMFVGGAMSIDIYRRTEGLSWWRDEELSYGEWFEVIDKYNQVKPKYMVTHDCPTEIGKLIIPDSEKHKSITAQALETMFESHKPDYWIFGHYHRSWRQNVLGTEFICLNELEHIDLELS
jgi:hypothetical protein